ncbi:VOC family protein [Metasolibacillus meyeri]|uniref:VOC family protein n=1 Tax=Metasolibacillus meyeri TaxID=1071052 RepID=A0AAW9NM04_9BACL|nr:VOC family protein [Metasolibacillus meyeri]MEC1177486.1 VOC family protein [Metasolibacillus meyeri]
MYELDHIVHFVDKPEQTMKEMQAHGFHVVQGGQHEMWGTYNTLSYFDLTYVEWIGINNEAQFEIAAGKPYTLHETYAKKDRKNGFTRMAIRTTTIEQDAEMFRQADLEVHGPERFTRTRPDGTVVSWQLLHIGHPEQHFDFPFFIEWDMSNEERRAQYNALNIIAAHPQGDIKLTEVIYLVNRLDYIKALQQLGNLQAEEHFDERLNAMKYTLYLPNAKIVCYSAQGEGEIWDAILADGLGIHSVVFEGAGQQQTIICENATYVMK